MTEGDPKTRWEAPEWLAEAREWIAGAARTEKVTAYYAGEVTPTGPAEHIHARAWSTVLRVPTDRGSLFFKANMPLLKGEAALCQAIYRARPDAVLPVLAADRERGWMLVPDGGPTLRSFLNTEADLMHAEALVKLLAGLQIDLSSHVDTLLDLVPFDRRLERLPDLFEALLEDREAFLIGTEDGLSAAEYEQLRALAPRYRDLCERLAAYGIPYSLHHDDFHDANVFTGAPGKDGDLGAVRSSGKLRIADWAESAVAHPFQTMLICLRALADRAGFPDAATDVPEQMHPALARLRDLYLEPWERYAPRARLVEAFNLAWRVGMVNRALTWRAVNQALEPPFGARGAYAVPGWLGEFLRLVG